LDMAGYLVAEPPTANNERTCCYLATIRWEKTLGG
jgi:hypothetical protein